MSEMTVTRPTDFSVPVPRRRHGSGTTTRTAVVIDDHCTFADLLRFAIDSDPDLECLGATYDLTSGLRLVASCEPDLVVMDYEFDHDEGDGLTATASITSRHPNVHVVLLTGHTDPGLSSRAEEAGAVAVLAKDGSLPGLMDVLKVAGQRDRLVPPPLQQPSHPPQERGRPENPLTPREQDVLAMLMVGMRSAEIAHELGISMHTSRGYIKTLLSKLGAHSQLEAVAIARRSGLALDG